MAVIPLSSLPPAHAALIRGIGATWDGAGWEVSRDERRISFRWLPATKSEPGGFHIETLAGPAAAPPRAEDSGFETKGYRAEPWATAVNPGPLLVRVESGRDRFGKRIGLNRETQIGDPDFDARIYIECDAPDAILRKLFASEASRRELLQVLELGAPAVSLDEKGLLSISLRRNLAAAPMTQEHFEGLLQAFAGFAEELPALRGRAPRRRRVLPAVLALGSLVGSILGIPALFLARWSWPPVDDDLYVSMVLAGIALWIVLIPVAFLVHRRRSTALRDWLMTVGFASFGAPVGCVALALIVNGGLDTSPPVDRDAWVVRRWTTSGKSTSYHLMLVPTAHEGRRYDLVVPRSTYTAVAVGSKAVVTTRAGVLGWPWLEAVTPKN